MPRSAAHRRIVFASAMLACCARSAHADGLMGGGPLPASSGQCVDHLTRTHVRQVADTYLRKHGRFQPESAPEGPLLYPFYPMAGTGDRDIFHGGFVDLDPAIGTFHDYHCTPFTYDGHAGIDTEIRGFAEQTIGVPVFAVRDGQVVFAQDGWPDMNTGGGVQGNIVGIDHGMNRQTWYYHLKNGSVAVTVGQQVKAGEQIGMVASSGNSFGPHLHFESIDAAVVYEPFAGTCRGGPSGWVTQPPMNLASYLDDFAITWEDIAAYPGLPFELPGEGQIAVTDQFVRFWLKGHNLPVGSTWRVRFYRPDDSLAFDGDWVFSNPELWRNYWFWWEYEIPVSLPDMQTITGRWSVRVDFNDELMVEAPIEVRPARTAGFNRPPEPVTIAMDPPAPTIDEAVFCRVTTPSLTVDDVDYDILRFRYVWTVNGAVVRDVTTAAHSDAVPHHTGCSGATLACEVTVSDGIVTNPPQSVSVVIPGTPTGDLNCDGVINVMDLILLLTAWGPCSGCPADLNSDGQVNVTDLLLLLTNWG